jgi:hypothetical protein
MCCEPREWSSLLSCNFSSTTSAFPWKLQNSVLAQAMFDHCLPLKYWGYWLRNIYSKAELVSTYISYLRTLWSGSDFSCGEFPTMLRYATTGWRTLLVGTTWPYHSKCLQSKPASVYIRLKILLWFGSVFMKLTTWMTPFITVFNSTDSL